MTASTLDGYTPAVGDLVWQQMYDPGHPEADSTIEERVAHGRPYGPRRQMIVRSTTKNYDAHEYARQMGQALPPRLVERWALQAADLKDRRGECRGFSWVESDWCVLELVDPSHDGRLL